MRGHLVNIINILFNERSRVALIMRLAPVETHKLAQKHNQESLDNALLLLGKIQVTYQLPLPKLYEKGEEKIILTSTNPKKVNLSRMWQQTRIVLDEEVLLLKISDYNNDLELLEYLAKALLQEKQLINIEDKLKFPQAKL